MRLDDILQDFLNEAEERFTSLERHLMTLERAPDDQENLAALFRGAHSLKGTCGFLGFRRLGALAHAAEDFLSALRSKGVPADRRVVDILLAALDVMRARTADIARHGQETAAALDGEAEMAETLEKAAQGDFSAAPPQKPAIQRSPALPAVRVSAEILDNLMAMSGALMLAQRAAVSACEAEEPQARQTMQLLAGLQSEILRARMQPVMEAWRRLPRIVRDMAGAAGLRARLETRGGDAQLDRHILDRVADPIAHLVRNALAHGFETPDARRAAGKPEEGVIQISARTAEGKMMITVSDDGRGIDIDAVADRAIKAGMITAAARAQMPEKDILQLVFRPGLSTAAQVDDLAGRGVGLDAVAAQMAQIGGAVEMKSRKGVGTEIVLCVPLTLAVIPAVTVLCASQRFLLPQADIAEFVRIGDTFVQTCGQRFLFWRGRHVPLCAWPAAEVVAGPFAAVVAAGGRYVALCVSSIGDAAPVLVKPVPPLLASCGDYLGVTLMPDGKAEMIMDVRPLLARHGVECADTAEILPEASDPRAEKYFVFHACGRRSAVPVAAVRGVLRMPLSFLHADPKGNLFYTEGGDMHALSGVLPQGTGDDDAQVYIIALLAGRALLGERIEGVENAGPFARDASCGTIGGQPADILHAETGAGAVLLVDDSNFFRELLTPLLQKAGYLVTSVPGADEALALRDVNNMLFDVIISDIEMPGMSGLEFAQKLKENDSRWRSVPLLGISAHATEHDEQRGRDAGFDDFITKFDQKRLLAAVAGLCGAGWGGAG